MNPKEMKKYSLLAEVACDYYERGLSQNEIAERICLSRTRVSRLLKEAEEAGIVQVSINYNFERHYELEERIKSLFSVKNVRVLNNRNRPKDRIQADVGCLGASYIMESLKKDMVIGTSWGTTLADTIKHIKPAPFPVHVVQLMGSVPCNSPNHTPQGIVSTMAELFQCQGSFLNLPLYIHDDYAPQVICNDINNKKIINQGMFSDMILTSISAVETISQQDFWLGYMTPEMYQEICSKGAVGAMFARFFDRSGNEVDCSWNHRCISISFDHIKGVPDVVVIASGRQKATAISYALKASLINTLITDGTTASAILGLNPKNQV